MTNLILSFYANSVLLASIDREAVVVAIVCVIFLFLFAYAGVRDIARRKKDE